MTKKPLTYFYKKVVTIPIYGGNFLIVFSNDASKVERIVNCKKDSLGYLYAFTFHNFLYNRREAFCVVFNFWDIECAISIGTIIHEVTHAANRVLASRGVEPSWDNDEAEAYLKGWMGDRIEDFMRECKIL